MKPQFPAVQGGGSLILAWQVRNRHVLVIGGGEVAAGRILAVLNADAKVTLISPSTNLNPEVRHRIASGAVTYIDREFQPSDLDPSLPTPPTNDTSSPSPAQPVDMVLCAIDSPTASTEIYKLCHRLRIPANIADVPPECDFYFGSVHRDGPLQIMVSTNGNGPKMAALVRRRIAGSLPGNTGAAIRKVGELRRRLRGVAPGNGGEVGAKRMRWMSKVCESWSLEDLCDMVEEDMDLLLAYYKDGMVPSLEQIRLKEEPGVYTFDGSFGWM
ncbi:siroheme synthase [Aulographum hederae CBS 113979]|uniref:precorrin-2 dehydrogenase n=1 Tax=Aulographum hederae CBS 113979 TaxID=1176131 RepID=A0A6G1HHB2_9PEZI|nr:siroheme synthase [Aulographum hederae CBS 113979]